MASGRREGPFLPHGRPPSVHIPERRAHHRRVGPGGLQPRRTRSVARAPTRYTHATISCKPPSLGALIQPLTHAHSLIRSEDPYQHSDMRLPRLPRADGAARRTPRRPPRPAVSRSKMRRACPWARSQWWVGQFKVERGSLNRPKR